MSNAGDLKVVYIMGFGRSGSTILGNVLGGHEGWMSIGERHKFWTSGLQGGVRCGCGISIPGCEVWSQVTSRMLGDGDIGDTVADIVRWQTVTMRRRNTLKLLRLRKHERTEWPELDRLVEVTDRLFTTVSEVTGTRVLVDSSKHPHEAALLGLCPSVVPYVVHLVRDPRAVAYSWLRKKLIWGGEEQVYLPRAGAAASTWSWTITNVLADRVRASLAPRSIIVRYESFAAEPEETLEAITRFVDGDATPEGKLERAVGVHHTIGGNPVRFESGPVKVRVDDEWMTSMKPADFMRSTALSLPLLIRHSYPIRRHGRRN